MKKPNTTSVVIVDTDAYELAKVALDSTLQRFAADEVLIFSDDAERWAPHPVRIIDRIAASADYNRVIIDELPHALTTDFALVIQFDGFAVNAPSFTPDFFDVDYIGAPWPASMFPQRGATVGNGGFSLRSRRLVEAAAARRASIDIRKPEDQTLCLQLREALEAEHGVRFAPLAMARRFSVELDRSERVTPFGFHGLHLLPAIYGDNYPFLIDNLPQRCFAARSYQLDNLRIGFKALGDEARARLELRANAPA